MSKWINMSRMSVPDLSKYDLNQGRDLIREFEQHVQTNRKGNASGEQYQNECIVLTLTDPRKGVVAAAADADEYIAVAENDQQWAAIGNVNNRAIAKKKHSIYTADKALGATLMEMMGITSGESSDESLFAFLFNTALENRSSDTDDAGRYSWMKAQIQEMDTSLKEETTEIGQTWDKYREAVRTDAFPYYEPIGNQMAILLNKVNNVAAKYKKAYNDQAGEKTGIELSEMHLIQDFEQMLPPRYKTGWGAGKFRDLKAAHKTFQKLVIECLKLDKSKVFGDEDYKPDDRKEVMEFQKGNEWGSKRKGERNHYSKGRDGGGSRSDEHRGGGAKADDSPRKRPRHCHFFRSKKGCNNGKDCKFAHTLPDETDRGEVKRGKFIRSEGSKHSGKFKHFNGSFTKGKSYSVNVTVGPDGTKHFSDATTEHDVMTVAEDAGVEETKKSTKAKGKEKQKKTISKPRTVWWAMGMLAGFTMTLAGMFNSAEATPEMEKRTEPEFQFSEFQVNPMLEMDERVFDLANRWQRSKPATLADIIGNMTEATFEVAKAGAKLISEMPTAINNTMRPPRTTKTKCNRFWLGCSVTKAKVVASADIFKKCDAKIARYLDDSGAKVKSGVSRHEHHFYKLTKRTGLRCLRGATGGLTQIEGIGNIRWEVETNHGRKVIELRDVFYAPSFYCDVVAHNDLKTQGWSFRDEQPQPHALHKKTGLRINFECSGGGNYWNAKIVKSNSTESPINTTTFLQTCHAIESTTDETELLNTLNSSSCKSTANVQQRCRVRLANLGLYTSRCPNTDATLALHCSLMHPSPAKTAMYIKQNYSRADIKKKFGTITMYWCDHCKIAKVKGKGPPRKHVTSTPKAPKATVFAEKTHADVAGPFPCKGRGTSFLYEIFFVDEYSGLITVYGMGHKAEVPSMVQRYFHWVEMTYGFKKGRKLGRSTGTSWRPGAGKIHGFRTDNDRVFTSHRIRGIYEKHNVKFETISPHSSWQMGYAERAIQTIHTKSTTAIMAGRLPSDYWFLADLNAVACNNITPTSSNRKHIPPYAAAFDRSIEANWLHIFGTPVFVHQFNNKGKLKPRGRQGVWVGFNGGNKSHRIIFESQAPTGGKRASYQESQHVQFHRPQPLHQAIADGTVPMDPGNPKALNTTGFWKYYKGQEGRPDATSVPTGLTSTQPQADIEGGAGAPAETQAETAENAEGQPAPNINPQSEQEIQPMDEQGDHEQPELPVTQGVAVPEDHTEGFNASEDDLFINTVLPPGLLLDGVPLTAPNIPGACADTESELEEDMLQECEEGEYIEQDEWGINTVIGQIYKSIPQAFKSKFGKLFRKSWLTEENQLINNGTLTKILKRDVPEGTKIFRSVTNHQLKSTPEGPLAKSRLCMDGSTQTQAGIDYGPSATATARWSTIRAMMSYAAAHKQPLFQGDLPNAFMSAATNRVRYMYMPHGSDQYDDNGDQIVFRCDGNIYGSRDAGRSFTDCYEKWICGNLGFIQSEHDPALFIRPAGDAIVVNQKGKEEVIQLSRIICTMWIDDCIFTCADEETKDWFASELNHRWQRPLGDGSGKMRDCKVTLAKFVVGMHVEQVEGSIKIHHKSLAEKLVKDFGQESCFPKLKPFPAEATISKADCPAPDERFELAAKYRSGVASVLYLACTTRPSLAKYASELGKVQANPAEKHYGYLIHLIQYIAGTIDSGIRYGSNDDDIDNLTGFCDASWADDVDDRRSTGGYICYMNGAPISWHSRIMHAVALSSCESELYSATDAAKDITHLRWIAEDITGQKQKGPTTLYEDNNAVISIASDRNKSISTRTKHVAARYFWVRTKVYDGTIILERCDTTEQVADALTKVSLSRETFEKFRSRMETTKTA
jgi:hypothetical protein